jgi:hypothetical protein
VSVPAPNCRRRGCIPSSADLRRRLFLCRQPFIELGAFGFAGLSAHDLERERRGAFGADPAWCCGCGRRFFLGRLRCNLLGGLVRGVLTGAGRKQGEGDDQNPYRRQAAELEEDTHFTARLIGAEGLDDIRHLLVELLELFAELVAEANRLLDELEIIELLLQAEDGALDTADATFETFDLLGDPFDLGDLIREEALVLAPDCGVLFEFDPGAGLGHERPLVGQRRDAHAGRHALGLLAEIA